MALVIAAFSLSNVGSGMLLRVWEKTCMARRGSLIEEGAIAACCKEEGVGSWVVGTVNIKEESALLVDNDLNDDEDEDGLFWSVDWGSWSSEKKLLISISMLSYNHWQIRYTYTYTCIYIINKSNGGIIIFAELIFAYLYHTWRP